MSNFDCWNFASNETDSKTIKWQSKLLWLSDDFSIIHGYNLSIVYTPLWYILLWLHPLHEGENMKWKANCTKVKVLSKDYIFHLAIFYWLTLDFSHNFSNIINLWHITWWKLNFFWHQTLDYSKIYNFTLDHDYTFKIIKVHKDVWISKSKSVYVFLFFECFEHMYPSLWNILKFTKKLKWFSEHLIRKKDFWNKKTSCPHFVLSALNI